MFSVSTWAVTYERYTFFLLNKIREINRDRGKIVNGNSMLLCDHVMFEAESLLLYKTKVAFS